MTQEEKQLLLKDLCGRLPYGVKVHNPNPKFPHEDEYIQTLTDIHGTMQSNWITFGTDCEEINVDWNIGNINQDVLKPYLRKMPSLDSEEYLDFDCNEGNDFDWLNSHHIDYRGLIEKRLALEAPSDMYNN